MAMDHESIKAFILNHLDYTLADTLIPELGRPKKGKVREIYMTEQNVVMIATDRVSAFDYVLPNHIPFKGDVLNKITRWAFSQTKDIVPNAVVEANIDDSVVIQKRLKGIPVECIVRGYLWGSMAAAYDKGDRDFCGLKLADGLVRFQKFDAPLFTPTTKGEQGAHDENMTMKEVEDLVGAELAGKMRDYSLKLYQRGVELAAKVGLMFIDTKYEFGQDENGNLLVMDEINTPDSSRLCDLQEWEAKFPQIEAEFKTGKWKSVTEMITAKPELKVKEFSKQYVRDLLVEQGFKAGGPIPTLTPEQVAESSARYISVYQRITGEAWQFPDVAVPPPQRLLANLQRHDMAVGCCVVVAAGSDSDLAHIQKIREALTKLGIPSHYRICSAHKQPTKLQQAISFYNQSIEPLIIVGCAGGTDALSGTASFLSVFPVVSCPPDGQNPTCLTNPPGSSNAFIVRPDNVARFAAQAFSHVHPKIKATLLSGMEEKTNKLDAADKQW